MTAAPPAPRNVEWGRAWRALRALAADPERTDQVFEIIRALAGQAGERGFQRFAASREGRHLLAERPSLLERLRDSSWLHSLPEGSFGRAYARFMEAGRLSAGGLLEAAQTGGETEELDAERRFYFERVRDMHDLWHVLTGYGRDVAGEAALLAFTYAQTRNRGIGAIVLTGAVLGPKTLDCRWQRYLLRAWRRGRRARPLALAHFEELLPRPLDEVRGELGIEPPQVAHPDGVRVFGDGSPAAS